MIRDADLRVLIGRKVPLLYVEDWVIPAERIQERIRELQETAPKQSKKYRIRPHPGYAGVR